jgi:glycosyltransferase involved in cell wall biosynthesis
MGGSHAAWARGYQAHSSHEVVLISHTDRFWKWRMHGAHVTLAKEFEDEVASNGPVDVVIGSSMLNGAGFLGLARRALGSARYAVYMHENQLGYPLSPRDKADLTYPMINWTSMAAADLVIFNSEYHRDQWAEELPRFLRQFPDYQQHKLIAEVATRSMVLPVGVDLRRFDAVIADQPTVPRVLWNQRWEYDKGPELLADAVSQIDGRGTEFELALAGEQFPTDPEVFVELRRHLGMRMVHYGWAEPGDYEQLLVSSDIVISTAHHEYFGIAITEAIYAGAFPLLPDRLVYPERIPSEFHDRCLYQDQSDLVEKLMWAVGNSTEAAGIASALKPEMGTYDWSVVAPRYDTALEQVHTHPTL